MHGGIEEASFDSLSELQEYLRLRPHSLWLGRDAESPSMFRGYTVPAGGRRREVGLSCSGFGVEPSVRRTSSQFVWFGYDARVVVVDLEGLSLLQEVTLAGVFYAFLDSGADDELVAVHELGAVKVSARSGVIWSFEAADVVADWSLLSDGKIRIHFGDGVEHTLSLETGRA